MTAEVCGVEPTGSVLLDIGGGVGAVVVRVDAALVGREIEARAEGHADHRAHATVLERRTVAAPVYAAVIAGLPAGAYTLWLDATLRWTDAVIEVRGGEVTEADNRGVPLPGVTA